MWRDRIRLRQSRNDVVYCLSKYRFVYLLFMHTFLIVKRQACGGSSGCNRAGQIEDKRDKAGRWQSSPISCAFHSCGYRAYSHRWRICKATLLHVYATQLSSYLCCFSYLSIFYININVTRPSLCLGCYHLWGLLCLSVGFFTSSFVHIRFFPSSDLKSFFAPSRCFCFYDFTACECLTSILFLVLYSQSLE